ncbi:MAG TPA: TadE family protein [Bryobacteraceae bacterium]|nr:TadE family protein [Bryobacteraceae bacterium]
MKESRTIHKSGKGHAVVEVTLMLPWIFLLFIGVFDFGFYSYALISTEGAARAGALYASSSWGAAGDGANVCFYVLQEMRMLPNVGSSTSCSCTGGSCTAGPIQITATPISGTGCVEAVAGAKCTRVTVQYQTVQLFPIPGLGGQLTMRRVAEASVRGD